MVRQIDGLVARWGWDFELLNGVCWFELCEV